MAQGRKAVGTMAESSGEEASTSEGENSEETSGEIDSDDEVIPAQLSNGAILTTVVAETLDDNEDGDKKKKQHGRCTPNIKALAVSAFLFALITVVQFFAAKIAHSQALQMDCISMGIDAFTYMGNIIVECRKRDGGDHKCSQLIVVAISLGCLVYFTYDAANESWGTTEVCLGWKQPASGEEDEDVNAYITLAFALGGVAFDLACLYAFYSSNKKQGSRTVNMFAALLHVGADFLRSSSTTIMSLLILFGGYDSTCLDAYTSLFIGATIICGAMFGFYKWVKLAASVFCGR